MLSAVIEGEAAEARASAFSVDVVGLLAALTEQFPEPLLCVRELIQNAADAGARRIEVDVSFDRLRSLVRLSVRDDGHGMGAEDVEGYLVIGRSDKGPGERGRFGIGKLSPYAMGIDRMVVDTCDGRERHHLEFRPDGSGEVEQRSVGPRGTVVKVFKACDSREEAESLSDRLFSLVKETCGSLTIPLDVNGVSVNQDVVLPTPYAVRFEGAAGQGVLGVGGEPVRTLMGGGIVLEMGAPVLGPELSYILDAPQLSPTLSRNAVRRDKAFDELLRLAQSNLPHLVSACAQVLRQRVERLRQTGAVVERALDPDDRAALEWLRARLLEPEGTPHPQVREAPVLETADGDLVSANALAAVLRTERRVPISRVPRTREEIGGYVDRGVPVLLLYRDLEDFLDQQSIPTVEVDGLDDGVEVAATEWQRGEQALVRRPEVGRRDQGGRVWPVLAASLAVVVVVLAWMASGSSPSASRAPTAPPVVAVPRTAPPPTPSDRSSRWPALGLAFASAAVGAATAAGLRRRRRGRAWLRDEAGLPLARGEGRRRLQVMLRMLLHPFDFMVARGWRARGSGGEGRAIAGYRAFAPEAPIRPGARLDLDALDLGFVDLVSKRGDPSDARMLVRRGERVLLNRNHPTVRDLSEIAASDAERAHLLLEALLATDPDLARGCDPRQVEWDLVRRAPQLLRGGRR